MLKILCIEEIKEWQTGLLPFRFDISDKDGDRKDGERLGRNENIEVPNWRRLISGGAYGDLKRNVLPPPPQIAEAEFFLSARVPRLL